MLVVWVGVVVCGSGVIVVVVYWGWICCGSCGVCNGGVFVVCVFGKFSLGVECLFVYGVV